MAGNNAATVADVKEAVDELREKLEKYGADSSEYKEMVDKTAKSLEEDEKAHQKFIASIETEKKKSEELEERLKQMEAEMAKVSSYGSKNNIVNYRELPEHKALVNYLKFGEIKLATEDRKLLETLTKTLRMDDDTAGGYLTTTEYDSTILRYITEISPVRTVARVRSVGKKTLEMPVRKTIPTATYEGEAEEGDEGNSTYGAESLTCYRLTLTVKLTMDQIMDANFDMEMEVNSDVGEGMAKKEGLMFVSGDASRKPEGFLSNASVIANAIQTDTALTVSGDDLIELTGELKVGYDPMYAFNRRTLAFLRTLKGTTNDHYIWQPSLASGAPNTINGEPYIVMNDMPDYNTANAIPIVYADFRRGYLITDRTGTVVIRDNITSKKAAMIEITFHRWNTGGVIIPEAFVPLQVKAA